MFFTWAARARENRIRFVGDEGAIEWTGGELRLERAGAVERLDYSAELEKTAYHRWFAGLFEGFVAALDRDRKSTRLNSSHLVISYAVFCLKKKKKDVAVVSDKFRHAA